MPRWPRDRFDLERTRRAGAAARARGGSAMDAALAEIGAAFDRAAVANAFKLRVEEMWRRGPQHPAARARFCARAELLRGKSLDAAIVLTERWWRAERQAFQIASVFGRGNSLSLDVLAELRLILRLMRWKRMRGHFPAILAALTDDPVRVAAE
jgi:hypothetical protein